MPNEILNQRLASFTPEYRDFIMSDFTEVVGKEIGEQYYLDEDTREAFENMLFLHITLFLSRIEFIEAVITDCGIGINDAINAVNNTLAKLPAQMVDAQHAAILTLTEKNNDSVATADRFGYINTLPTTKLSVYLYVKATPTIKRLCAQYNLTGEEMLEQCRTLLGDIVLGFYKIEDTVPLLQQELGLDAKTAALLGADVLDFLTPLSDPDFQIPNEVFTSEETMPATEVVTNGFAASVATPTFSQQSAPVAPELHTMATDAAVVRSGFTPMAAPDNIPTYSSEQPSFTRNLSDVPSYATPTNTAADSKPTLPVEKPRW